jgi:uncharacterized membrane protein
MSTAPINETARIEAFSDGIFSIAATLLVLNLKYPSVDQRFWPALAHMWPGFVSFVLSFFFIGIMWINHHRLFVHIKKSDDMLLAANLLLLLGVVFVPYPTALMAASITMLDTGYSRDVALFYNATYLMMSLLYNLLWYVCRSRKLLDGEADHDKLHTVSVQYLLGPFLYLLCLLMTWWSVPVSLAINAGVALYFLMPLRHRSHRRPAPPQSGPGLQF